MRFDKQRKAFTRITLAVAATVLGGCVSDAYLYDANPGVYYRGSAGYPPYYSYGYPGYYGYPRYYAPSGYYGYSPYPPRVVYYDHDHRGDDCRHPSHRDGPRGDHPDRHDRNDRDHPPPDRDGRPDRRPPGEGPATPPAPADRPLPPAHRAGRAPSVQPRFSVLAHCPASRAPTSAPDRPASTPPAGAGSVARRRPGNAPSARECLRAARAAAAGRD